MSYLLRMFHATEEANRQTITDMLENVHAANLLDLGCGDGSFTVRLGAGRNIEMCGVEIDPARAEEARQRSVAVEEADLNKPLPYPDDSFDIVHANQVIEHLHDTDMFLSEVRRISRKTVVVSTNNLASWHNIASLVLGYQPPPAHVSSRLIVGNPVDPLYRTTHPTPGDAHLRIYTMRSFRDLCEHHGFHVSTMRGVGYYPLFGRLARLAAALDSRHSAFFVAKLQAKRR